MWTLSLNVGGRLQELVCVVTIVVCLFCVRFLLLLLLLFCFDVAVVLLCVCVFFFFWGGEGCLLLLFCVCVFFGGVLTKFALGHGSCWPRRTNFSTELYVSPGLLRIHQSLYRAPVIMKTETSCLSCSVCGHSAFPPLANSSRECVCPVRYTLLCLVLSL